MNIMIRFAHRGSITEAPDNTVSSIQKALEHGAKAIEIDVQLTRDEELVLFHDFTICIHGTKRRITDCTKAELKQVDMEEIFTAGAKGTEIATLSEVLDICSKDILINIEFKNQEQDRRGIEKRVAKELKAFGFEENVLISSFDHQCLEQFQHFNPEYKLGMLFQHQLIQPWLYAKQTGLNIYSLHPYYESVTKEFVENSHAHGYAVIPFTVDDSKQMTYYESIGVDGIFTNNPTQF